MVRGITAACVAATRESQVSPGKMSPRLLHPVMPGHAEMVTGGGDTAVSTDTMSQDRCWQRSCNSK